METIIILFFSVTMQRRLWTSNWIKPTQNKRLRGVCLQQTNLILQYPLHTRDIVKHRPTTDKHLEINIISFLMQATFLSNNELIPCYSVFSFQSHTTRQQLQQVLPLLSDTDFPAASRPSSPVYHLRAFIDFWYASIGQPKPCIISAHLQLDDSHCSESEQIGAIARQ